MDVYIYIYIGDNEELEADLDKEVYEKENNEKNYKMKTMMKLFENSYKINNLNSLSLSFKSWNDYKLKFDHKEW